MPDEDNFAMTPFLAPLYDFHPGTQNPKDNEASERAKKFGANYRPPAWLDKGRAPWRHRQRTLIPDPAAELNRLQPYEAVLDELQTASRRPHARFNLHYQEENPFAIQLPHLTVLKTCVQMLHVRARTRLALGQGRPALDDIFLALRLTDAMKTDPVLISHLVRIANIQQILAAVWDGLAVPRWTETQLTTLQARLESIDLLTGMDFAFKAERAWGTATITSLLKDRIKMTQLDGDIGGSFPIGVMPRGWLDFELVNYNRLYGNLIDSTYHVEGRRVFPKIVKDNEALLPGSRHWVHAALRHHILAGLLLPALTKVVSKSAAGQTVLDQAILAVALERHRLSAGTFPDSLEVLAPRFLARLPHDVITGRPFIYRREETNRFLLYSVGWNETDDGGDGAETDDRKKSFDPAEGDWVWHGGTPAP